MYTPKTYNYIAGLYHKTCYTQGRTWTKNTGGAKKIRHYRRRKIYPNNLVKPKTIYEITTNTTYIYKKRTQTK
jgi:hypothetical protein